jgi:hypothetical protein
MKLIMKSSALLMFALAMVAVTSCNKYEEGSNFSLLSAKARMVNTWTLTKVEYNGNDVTGSFPGVKSEIKKDNTYTTTYSVGSLNTQESGKWAFNSDKTALILTPNGEADSEPITILMLKNKMLKLKDVDGSNTTIITYEGE